MVPDLAKNIIPTTANKTNAKYSGLFSWFDLGKRKDFPYLGLRGKCESCKYKKMRNYQNKYYKERWHTDPEYKAKRKKWTTDWVEKTGWVR